MAPQTPPLDRRDLYKDRRHDRGPWPGSSDSARWRDPYYPSSRDYPRRAPPPGYHRSYVEDSGPRGGTPSRSDRFWQEEQNHYRSCSGRYDRGRASGGRDMRGGPYLYRRSPNYDPYHADYRRSPQYDPYPYSYPYPYPTDYNPRHYPGIRSVAVPISSSRIIPDTRAEYYRRPGWERKSEWNRDRDRDRDRKPMKSARSGSVPREASREASESPRKRRSRDRQATVAQEKSLEEDLLAKKARIGWGQGLAKYEKLKVGPSDEPRGERVVPGMVMESTDDAAKDAIGQDKSVGLKDGIGQELTLAFEPDSSTGTDAKPCTSAVDTNCEGVPLPKIDPLDGNSMDALATILTDLLQPDDTHTGDVSLIRHASLNKLSQLKESISKHLETTEAEIDSLETELKLLLPDPESAVRETKTALGQTVGIVQSISEDKAIQIQDDNINPNLVSTILAANWDASRRATSLIDNGLHLADPADMELLVSAVISQKEKNELRIKAKLRLKKSGLKFKERVLACKYRVLHHVWKDELKHFPSGKRNRTKPTRSRLISHACNSTPFATKKASGFARKLMSDSDTKPYRAHLKMPAQILDEAERTHAQFVSQNGLIADPVAFEKERALINPWTPQEKEKFMEMLCLFGKDFGKISSFFPHKTTADCVEFYYKSHKSESFAEVRKHLIARKKPEAVTTGNYLGTSTGKKRTRECSVVSLDKLGAPSVVAVKNPNRLKSKTTAKKVKNPCPKNKSRSSKKKRSVDPLVVTDRQKNNSSIADRRGVDVLVVGFQKGNLGCLDRAKGVDPLTGFAWTHSSEGMSSCITASPGDKEKSFEDNEDACSDDGWQDVGPAWTDSEKCLIVQGLGLYGNDFERISTLVGSRTRDQCKTFFSKSWKVLNLEAGFPENENPGNGYATTDVKEGKAVSDEGCVAETESGACSTQSCSKQEGDGCLAPPTKAEDVNLEVQGSEKIPEMSSSDKVGDVIVLGKLIELSGCVTKPSENEIRGNLGKDGLEVDGSSLGSLEVCLSDKRYSRMEGVANNKSKESGMEILSVSDPMED